MHGSSYDVVAQVARTNQHMTKLQGNRLQQAASKQQADAPQQAASKQQADAPQQAASKQQVQFKRPANAQPLIIPRPKVPLNTNRIQPKSSASAGGGQKPFRTDRPVLLSRAVESTRAVEKLQGRAAYHNSA